MISSLGAASLARFFSTGIGQCEKRGLVEENRLPELVGAQLRGGFTIAAIVATREPLLDAIGREAIARTQIVGRRLSLVVRSGLSRPELSVTIYHEVLEAATVAALFPPAVLSSFNEGDFERTAYAMQKQFGDASSENLDQMLQLHGF